MKTKELSVILVEYGDLEDLIKETFGHEFSIPEDLECNNDTYHLFRNITEHVGVTFFNNGSSFKADWTIDDLNEFKEAGNHNGLLRTILEELCRLGKIKPGHYLVNVSW